MKSGSDKAQGPLATGSSRACAGDGIEAQVQITHLSTVPGNVAGNIIYESAACNALICPDGYGYNFNN